STFCVVAVVPPSGVGAVVTPKAIGLTLGVQPRFPAAAYVRGAAPGLGLERIPSQALPPQALLRI
ncbi:MAG: hypothetical protein ACO4AJ_09390, partial [Prochlorothrix sp.]